MTFQYSLPSHLDKRPLDNPHDIGAAYQGMCDLYVDHAHEANHGDTVMIWQPTRDLRFHFGRRANWSSLQDDCDSYVRIFTSSDLHIDINTGVRYFVNRHGPVLPGVDPDLPLYTGLLTAIAVYNQWHYGLQPSPQFRAIPYPEWATTS